MRRTRKSAATAPRTDVDAALAAMGADELREVVREMLLELDDRAHGRVTTTLISRAVRGGGCQSLATVAGPPSPPNPGTPVPASVVIVPVAASTLAMV